MGYGECHECTNLDAVDMYKPGQIWDKSGTNLYSCFRPLNVRQISTQKWHIMAKNVKTWDDILFIGSISIIPVEKDILAMNFCLIFGEF